MNSNVLMKLTLITLITFSISFLQGKFFEVLGFRELPSDFTAQRELVLDDDMNYTAALRIEIPEPVNVTINEKIYKTDTINGNKYIFFSPREKQLTLKAPNFEPYKIPAPDRYGFQSGQVYQVLLGVLDKVNLSIVVYPENAQIYLDNIPWDKIEGPVEQGSYLLHISKNGYNDITETINVSHENSKYIYNLTKIDTPFDSEDVVIDKSTPITVTDRRLSVLNAYDYTFRVLSVIASPDNNVTIRIQVTNHADQDRELTITRNTKFYDNHGREWTVDIREIGNSKETWLNLTHRIISEVPTEMVLTFNDVSRSATNISLLELIINNWNLEIRSLPISR